MTEAELDKIMQMSSAAIIAPAGHGKTEMIADIATVPFPVLKKLVQHPLTDRGLESFMADWEKVKNA